MDAKTIAGSSGATAQLAAEALEWVAVPRNAQTILQERPAIEQRLRRAVGEGLRLERAVSRPTCVGVFGPSQAGKSYLISILARKDGAPLVATFAGDRPEVDFIRDINPLGGDESTGVVTRFTTHAVPTPHGFPVCLRLLSQTDIVKILINSYFQDGDQEYEAVLDTGSVEAMLNDLETAARPGAVDVFGAADVWDLQEYVQRNSGGAANAAIIEPFWSRIADLAPRLTIPARARLLAILWGGHETYTAIFLRLVEALAALSFQADAFCAVSALIPSRESVINVNALDGIHDDGAMRLDLSDAGGRVVSLPRPIVTALVAELRIVCRDKPLPFFDHTDLLDFPGYRTRFKRDLKKYFRDAADTASKEVFLRGKVDYLFQRYTSDLELTTMILCIPDSVMEVANLPKAIETWVGMTHGATPERRQGKPTLLFFAMTKFDRTLERKAGGHDGDLAEKFAIRFNASLSPFSKVEPSWVRQWSPGRPFRNTFLIRNPNVQFMGVIDYEGAHEVRVNPAELPRLEALRAAFVSMPVAKDHFANPGAAWDALMALDDGGAGELARALERVCAADLKLGQIADRVTEVRREIVELLARYYISDDLETRRAERLAVVDDRIFPDLNECAERGSFGSALRGLMIDSSDLHGSLVEALNRSGPEFRADTPQPAADKRPRGPFSSRKEAPAEAPAPVRADRWTKLSEAALSCWASFLHGRVADPVFERRAGIAAASLREIVAEIGSAARRVDLATRIAGELRARSAPNEQNEAIARKAALIAERLINRFVSELDFDRIAPNSQEAQFGEDLRDPVFAPRGFTYDTSGIMAAQPDFTTLFMEQWGRAFRATVSQNAMSKSGSIEDAAQNARLGKILRSLST